MPLLLFSIGQICFGEVSSAYLEKCVGYGDLIYGTYAYSEGEIENSLTACQYAIEYDPQLARAYFREGNAYFDLKQLDQAKASYLKSVELEPEYFFSQYNLACLAAVNQQEDEALGYIEEALQRGYDRYDNFFTDSDLASLRDSSKLKALVDSYRDQDKQNDYTRFILMKKSDEKVGVISSLLEDGGEHWEVIAQEALLDSGHEVRYYALFLFMKYADANRQAEVLTRSLFDNNGYVCKLAGNLLVTIPDAALPYMELILESDGYENQKFYAKQVKNHIEQARAAAKAEPAEETPGL